MQLYLKNWKNISVVHFSNVPSLEHVTLLKKDLLSGIFLGFRPQVQNS